MLLQLLEPGMTPLPHDQPSIDIPKIAVGIDLGTTNSLVAFSDKQCPRILKVDSNQQPDDQQFVGGILPSVVYYPKNGQTLVGNMAAQALEYDPRNVVTSVKRLIGRHNADDSYDEQLIKFHTLQSFKNPVQVSADILKALKLHAEKVLGVDVAHAVITVPAHFDDTARTLTRDAARLAGIEVLRIINEPTAAALAYGLDKGVQGLYAVYDLGGGTFDFSILRLQKGVFQVLATGGDTHLGGDDFNECIVDHILEKYNVVPHASHSAMKCASNVARSLKERLSCLTSIKEVVDIHGSRVHIHLTKSDLKKYFKPLIDRTLNICDQAIMDAKINRNDLQGVIMVGGSTRMPSVVKAVKKFFACPVLQDINPDEAVALGASLQAESLTQGSNTLLLDINPLSLGLETMGGIVEKIIPRNSSIPLSLSQEFTTFEDGQTAILIHVIQGERELVKDCCSLAQFEINGIPPLPAGIARIQVTFTLDADGLLTVVAQEKTTGIVQTVEVKPTYGLDIQQLNQLLMESFEHAEQDINDRALQKIIIESAQLLNVLEPALQKQHHLIDNTEHQVIEGAITALKVAQSGKIYQQIKDAVENLEQKSQNFIEKRLDDALKHVLTGHSLTKF